MKKASIETNGQSESGSDDVSWGTDAEEDNFKNLDYGMSMGMGFELKALTIGSSYDYGFANISTYRENGLLAQNRVLKLSIGYLFKGNLRGGFNRGGNNRGGNKRRRR